MGNGKNERSNMGTYQTITAEEQTAILGHIDEARSILRKSKFANAQQHDITTLLDRAFHEVQVAVTLPL